MKTKRRCMFQKDRMKTHKILLQLDIEPKSRACVSHDHIFIVIVIVLETKLETVILEGIKHYCLGQYIMF